MSQNESAEELAQLIDHTLLRADATPAEIERLAQEAMEHRFKSVCVNPAWVRLAAQVVDGSDVLVCTTIGFPLGATTAANKAREAEEAVSLGAHEVDMVIAIGMLKSRRHERVKEEIAGVVKAAGPQVGVKVILETALLTEDERREAAAIVVDAGAAFVKTSTGFGPRGATVDDVKLLREVVGSDFGVKASGGIRTRENALEMVQAGANRLGTSSGIAIIGAAAEGS